MGILRNILNGRAVQNAVQQMNGFNGYQSTNTIYTRDISKYFDGVNKTGQYDNYYGDYNRIITTAPTFPIFYVDKNNEVVEGTDFVKWIETPNDKYPQYKVLQQIYSEMITHGHSDIFLWRKDGKSETTIFEPGKQYSEDDFRGISLVSGYDQSRLTKSEKQNIIRIQYGVSQECVFLGYSPTQAAKAWRTMQDEMGLHMTAFARNAGMPIGKFIITAPNPEEYVKMRDKLEGQIAGARNNGKVLFDYRPTDSKVTQIEWVEFTSKEVQDYTSQLEFSDKKMSQSFGVPGTIKGTNDGENYATARVSQLVFIEYTIKPLVTDAFEQIKHAIGKRFKLAGELKVTIPLPEIADESLVKIQATTLQRTLYYEELEKGIEPETIIRAYNLPESFLLLGKSQNNTDTQNKVKPTVKPLKGSHTHTLKNDLLRKYQNSLTKKEKEEIESAFRSVTDEYVDTILNNGVVAKDREDYVGKMSVTFSAQYSKLYDKALDDIANALIETIDVADVADLALTDDELEQAVEQYRQRVADFSKTFSEDVSKLPGKTLTVRKANAQPNIDRVVVTESEHTRIVSELDGWTKAQEEFPVRVYKKWNTMPDACPECLELEDTEIDVTALFINNPNIDEIYEVQGGGLHPNCRCFCTYVMEGEDVRRFEGDET